MCMHITAFDFVQISPQYCKWSRLMWVVAVVVVPALMVACQYCLFDHPTSIKTLYALEHKLQLLLLGYAGFCPS